MARGECPFCKQRFEGAATRLLGIERNDERPSGIALVHTWCETDYRQRVEILRGQKVHRILDEYGDMWGMDDFGNDVLVFCQGENGDSGHDAPWHKPHIGLDEWQALVWRGEGG